MLPTQYNGMLLATTQLSEGICSVSVPQMLLAVQGVGMHWFLRRESRYHKLFDDG